MNGQVDDGFSELVKVSSWSLARRVAGSPLSCPGALLCDTCSQVMTLYLILDYGQAYFPFTCLLHPHVGKCNNGNGAEKVFVCSSRS